MISSVDFYRSEADADAFERAAPIGPFPGLSAYERAIHGGAKGGGNDELKKYWLHGPGLKKWATKPHPWTSLYHHILKHVGNPGMAKRIASQWFHDHFGYWPGSRKGKNPVGKG